MDPIKVFTFVLVVVVKRCAHRASQLVLSTRQSLHVGTRWTSWSPGIAEARWKRVPLPGSGGFMSFQTIPSGTINLTVQRWDGAEHNERVGGWSLASPNRTSREQVPSILNNSVLYKLRLLCQRLTQLWVSVGLHLIQIKTVTRRWSWNGTVSVTEAVLRPGNTREIQKAFLSAAP